MKKPRKGWNFRIIGYNKEGRPIDSDDAFYLQSAERVACQMLMPSLRLYKPNITKVTIYNKRGTRIKIFKTN